MNINRHNYETFFLLYVDNELPAAERKAVEEFVKENTDLASELEILMETTLPAEPVSFFSKDELYKNEISQDVQEDLLMHLDNELDASSIKNIQSLIASNTAIQHEWEILQKARLDTKDKIVFKDKKLLYRHENSRVISIRFWRMAAAAAVIFAVLFTGISILKKDGVEDAYVINEDKQSTGNKQTAKVTQPANSINPAKNSTTNDPVVNSNTTDQLNTAATKPASSNTPQEHLAANNRQPKEKNNSTKDRLENINKEPRNETFTSTVLNKKEQVVFVNKAPDELAATSIKDKITAPTAPLIDYNSVSAMPDSYATTAAFNEAPENNNKILYMNEETVTRSKVGGLFRKVKRVIERNTNIKTGNGVKIAGFEIAVK